MATTIKLDYDNIDSKDEIPIDRICRVIDYYALSPENYLINRSNNGFHVRITVKEDLPDEMTVVVQLLMGSDYQREMINYRRIREDVKNWNVLHEGTEKEEILNTDSYVDFIYTFHKPREVFNRCGWINND